MVRAGAEVAALLNSLEPGLYVAVCYGDDTVLA